MKPNSLLLAGFILLAAVSLRAADVTLSNLNTTVIIDPDSPAGIKSWVVDGVSHLKQQWFWYRIGTNLPALSIDTLTNRTVTQPNARQVEIVCQNAEVRITISLALLGGGTGSRAADLSYGLTLENLKTTNIVLHLLDHRPGFFDG